MIPNAVIREKLSKTEVFSRLDPGALSSIVSASRIWRCNGKTVLFRRGEAADAMFVVLGGQVELGLGDAEEIVGEGEALGAWALIDPAPRVATAIARPNAMLLKLDRAAFRQIQKTHRGVRNHVLRALTKRTRTIILQELVRQSVL